MMGFRNRNTNFIKSDMRGARDFLVPTRNLNEFYALPQSAIIQATINDFWFEKYFQIADVLEMKILER
ncbi:hypothetical protein NWQ33_00690 [Mycoplasmopsis cynos]|nr:hypothetical protein [Mycoplasmopsis cynos]